MNTKPSAKIIAHSKSPSGEELITMEIELHRFVLPEFNTHRTFSRNFQSSRAVPVEKLIDQVRNDPAMPVFWGKNQRGMVAEEEILNYKDFGQGEYQWLGAAIHAAERAETLHKQGYHKQIVNRLLEPFMWTKGVVTATRTAFEAFFLLRSHKDAQPEIKALSDQMKCILEKSVPNKLSYGEYHIPYVPYSGSKYLGYTDQTFFINDEEDNSHLLSLEQAIKISTSCSAQVSYRSLDDSLEKAEKIFDMLNLPKDGKYGDNPPHFSPTEHVAKVVENSLIELSSTGDFYNGETNYLNGAGNFDCVEFWQYRKALEVGLEGLFMEVN